MMQVFLRAEGKIASTIVSGVNQGWDLRYNP